MKCEVAGCDRNWKMSVKMKSRFPGVRRVCQGHWKQLRESVKKGEEMPFAFKEKVNLK